MKKRKSLPSQTSTSIDTLGFSLFYVSRDIHLLVYCNKADYFYSLVNVGEEAKKIKREYGTYKEIKNQLIKRKRIWYTKVILAKLVNSVKWLN